MKHWDVGYWAERMREAKYELTEEELRPYFALPVVLEGLFALTSKLFGVSITPADGEAPVWHPDVKFFTVRDTTAAASGSKSGQGGESGGGGAVIANFYLDSYSRPAEKQGGAWMDPLIGRSKRLALDGKDARLPVAVLVCNQMVPVNDKPSLMTFREVSHCTTVLQYFTSLQYCTVTYTNTQYRTVTYSSVTYSAVTYSTVMCGAECSLQH